MNQCQSKWDITAFIFQGRWVLAPLYLSLIPACVLYLYKYFRHFGELFMTVHQMSDTELLLGVLHLLDMVMVCNLLVVTMIGGFSLFVRRIMPSEDLSNPNRLTWLEHIDPTTLKIKWGMALIGVSSIHLLEAFIGAGGRSWEELSKLLVIHLVFVVSTLGLAMLNKKQ